MYAVCVFMLVLLEKRSIKYEIEKRVYSLDELGYSVKDRQALLNLE